MRRAARADSTQPDIVRALTQMGYDIIYLHQLGGGYPDLLVGIAGDLDLVECKSGEKATYTPDQIQFNRTWKGKPPVRLNSYEHAIQWAREKARLRRYERPINSAPVLSDYRGDQ